MRTFRVLPSTVPSLFLGSMGTSNFCLNRSPSSNKRRSDPNRKSGYEAGAGIEPANRGFADPDLTTWLPRRFANRSVGARLGGVNGRGSLSQTLNVGR